MAVKEYKPNAAKKACENFHRFERGEITYKELERLNAEVEQMFEPQARLPLAAANNSRKSRAA